MNQVSQPELDDEASMLAERKARTIHDIRASLAIMSGYGQALESSFGELSKHIDALLERLSDEADVAGDVKTLEADCRFCLSRLSMSASQLKERLAEVDSPGENRACRTVEGE